MTLPEYAIKRRVTTVMVFCGIVFLGLIALTRMSQELFPRISFPQVTVVTDYANAAPEEIETLITRPLEEAISSVSGLRRIESISREGKSTVSVAFNWNQDIDFAALAVREKIDLVKERLPKESEDPVVLKFDPLSKPVLILSVTGKMSPVELKEVAEHTLQDNLEKVEGVASITVSGGMDREIIAEIDQGQLQSAGASLLQVIDSIDTANVSYPAGSIKKGLYEYLIRTVGEFRSIPEIGFTVIKAVARDRSHVRDTGFVERGAEGPRATLDTEREQKERGIQEKRLVLLNDIGIVQDTFAERTTISRHNQQENVSVAIQKQATTNSVELVDRIRLALVFLQEDLNARGMQVKVVYDQSEFVSQAIEDTKQSALEGGLLAAIVLFFFFWDFRSAGLIALSVPISVLGSFFLLNLQGITINTMSLSGMALGIGMMVDNCIVVLENIFRLREEGRSPEDASVDGANEVFWPVFSSTLTTDAVFLPLILFVPGVAGQLFKDLSWAIIHCSNISFLISVWLIPMAAVYIQPPAKKAAQNVEKRQRFQKQVQDFFAKRTHAQQNTVLLSIVLVALVLFFVGVAIFRSLDTEVLPKVDQGKFFVKLNLPVGSRIEATDELAKIVEKHLDRIQEVETIQVDIGSASSSKIGAVKVDTLRASQALILVSLNKDRKRSSYEVIEDLKQSLGTENLAQANIEYMLEENEFAFATAGGKPIVIEVKGYDLEILRSLAEEAERKIKNIPGVMEVISDVGERSPETMIEIDKKKASLYAISARDISLTAKAAIDGAVATKYKEAGREIDVRVRLREKDREDMTRLGDLLVRSDSLEISVPLKAIATIKSGYGPSEIKRKDQIRTVSVAAAIKKDFKEKNVLKSVAEAIAQIDRPETYEVKLVGKAREVRESFRMIAFAITLALILNYMIMAAQFESFLQPFVIMLVVPLALFGIAVALLLTGTAVSVISLMGILLIGGSGTNSGIILIDFINQRRIEGARLMQAAIESAFVRFRAIMMSALTAAVGLIPLSFGADLQAPLAISMIGGTISSTLLTLCVIPAVYVLMIRLSDRILNGPLLTDEAVLE